MFGNFSEIRLIWIRKSHADDLGKVGTYSVCDSQSQCSKSHFPSAKIGQSQFPFYPFRALYMQLQTVHRLHMHKLCMCSLHYALHAENKTLDKLFKPSYKQNIRHELANKLFLKQLNNLWLTMVLNQTRKIKRRGWKILRKLIGQAAILNFRLKSAFIAWAHTQYMLSQWSAVSHFKMSLTGRTLSILGRSATRIRCTGVRRLRSEVEEGPGNVSVLYF